MEEDSRPKEEQNMVDEASGESGEYSFLQEVIKDENGRWRALKKRWIRLMGWGLVFGIAASLGFAWTNRLSSSRIKEVTIPKEEEAPGQEEPQELDSESYLQMQQALGEVAKEAGRSVVEIRILTSKEDWTEQTAQTHSITGIVVADNGREILIWGKTMAIAEGASLQAVFSDGSKRSVTLKQKDDGLGMGIYAVETSRLKSSTMKQLKVAVLGSSNFIQLGEPVLALGSPLGDGQSMGVGGIMSKDNRVSRVDGSYGILQTDIAAGEEGSGVLVNLKGEIVGVIDQSVASTDSALVAGYGISDLKRTMELLSNGQGIPYLGICGLEVTEEIQEQGVPRGIYMKEVMPGSPAMAAGLQNGDILTGIGTEKVTTLTEYRNCLLKLNAGEKVRLKGLRQGAEGYVDIEFEVTVGKQE